MMTDREFNELTIRRAGALDTLTTITQGITDADDYGDMVGAIRLVELAAEQARRTIIAEARAAGYQWEDVSAALGVTAQEARKRYDQPGTDGTGNPYL